MRVVEEMIEAWSRRDLPAVLRRLHPDCEVRPAETNRTLRGHEEFAAGFEDWFEAFEEFSVNPEDFRTHDDRVLVSMRQRARGKGSGVEVEQRFYQLFTVRDGLVFGFEEFADEPEALRAFD